MALHRLTAIEVGVPDVEAAVPFYTDFGLEHLGDGRFATADGGEQLRLIQGPRRTLIEIGIGADHPDDIARAADAVGRAGFAHELTGGELLVTDPGSGVRARVQVADRYHQQPTVTPSQNGPASTPRANIPAPGGIRSGRVRPRKLGHVVIGSMDVDASEKLFVGTLGFNVSDTIRGVGKFVRCSEDHHNLMVSSAPGKFLHHTSWQVDDVDEVGRGASDMVRADATRHVWGLGRHNIGSNFFWYLRDPTGNFAEYYSDLDIITEELKWHVREWEPRGSTHAWGPRPPKDFYLADVVAETMMKGGG